MLYQRDHLYKTLPNPQSSAFSRPRRDAQGSYEIHFIKSEDPTYIPEDFEAWPLYHRCILDLLGQYPAIFQEAIQAVSQVREKLKGLENRHLPPGSGPKIW